MEWCTGPSRTTAVLAYLAAAYLIASVIYCVLTVPFGTPFNDSLTDTQKTLKRAAACRRGAMFAVGVGVAAVTLAVWRPIRVAPRR